ncbi:hypothetical protein IJJ39_01965, partial [Candidatus Saccharibacteria bacterium]|nr:hypothetical protein [Candidatus Saccharibacteria bacterium]
IVVSAILFSAVPPTIEKLCSTFPVSGFTAGKEVIEQDSRTSTEVVTVLESRAVDVDDDSIRAEEIVRQDTTKSGIKRARADLKWRFITPLAFIVDVDFLCMTFGIFTSL